MVVIEKTPKQLIEIILDFGRRPILRFYDDEEIDMEEFGDITDSDMKDIVDSFVEATETQFSSDNRIGIEV